MHQTPDIDIVRLEGQLYDHSPHLRWDNEVLKMDRRKQLLEQLQNSILKVELEVMDMDTIIRNSDNLFEKSQNLNVLSSVEFDSEECIPKPLQLSESSEDDGEYTRPLSVIKQLEIEDKEMKYLLQIQEPLKSEVSLGPVSDFNEDDNDKTWTVGRMVRKSLVSSKKKHKQSRRSFRGLKRNSVRDNEHNENGTTPDTPLTLSIRLPEVIRENRKKLEISIDLGRIDLSRKILGSELCCFNEEQLTQPTITNAINKEIQAIENPPSSQQSPPSTTMDEHETEDEKALSHLISEVLVEPNAVETWRATNAINNINNNLADNYNANLTELPCYADSAANKGQATKRRKNNNINKNKSQGPPKKRGRKPGRKNCPKLEQLHNAEVFENQPKSDLAKYVELFSNNCELPASTTPAASSTMSQLVTSTTQHLDTPNEQPITYFIEGDWANGGNCQLISTGNGDAGQIAHEDFNMTELVNYIDSSTTDVGNNVIARVLEGGNVVPVSVSMPSFSNVYRNNNSSNIIQLPTMKYVTAANNSHHIMSHPPLPLQCNTIATNMQISSMSPPAAHNCEGVLDLSKKSSNQNQCLNIFTKNNSDSVRNDCSSDYGPIDLSLKNKKQPNERVPQKQKIPQHIVVDDESDDNFIRRLIVEASGIDFKQDVSRNPPYIFCPMRQAEQRITADESFKAALDMPLLDMENSSQNVESLKTPPSLISRAEQDIKGSNNLSLNTSLISGNNVFNNTIEFADRSSKELFERLLEVGDSVSLECENNNLTITTCEMDKTQNLQVDGDLNNLVKLFDANNDNSKKKLPVAAEKHALKKPNTPLGGNKVQLETGNEVEKVGDTLLSKNCNDANDKCDGNGNGNDNTDCESEVYGQMEKITDDSDLLSSPIRYNNTIITGVEKKEAETEEAIENKEVLTLDDIEHKESETEDKIESVDLNEIASIEIENELKASDSLQNEVSSNSDLKRNSRDADERKVDIISVVHLDSFNWTKDADNAYIRRILSKVKPAEQLNKHYNDRNNNAKNAIKFESSDLTSQNKCNPDDEEKTYGPEIPTVSNVGKKEAALVVGPTKNIPASARSTSSEDLLFVDIEDFQEKSFVATLAVDNEKDPLESIAASNTGKMTVEDLNKSTTSCYSDSNIDLREDEARGDDVNLNLSIPKLTLLGKSSEAFDALSLDLQHEIESDIESNYISSQQKIEVHDVDYLQLSDKNNDDVASMEGSQEIVSTNFETDLSNENLTDAIQNNDDDRNHEQDVCLQSSEKSNNENIMLESSQYEQPHYIRISNGPATPNLSNADAKYKTENTAFACVIDDLQLSEESQDIKISNDIVASDSAEHSLEVGDTEMDNEECGCDCINGNIGENKISEMSNKTYCLVNIPESQDIDMSDVSSNPSTQNLTDSDELKMKDEIVCDCDDYDIQLSEESQDIKISEISDPEKQNLNDVDDANQNTDNDDDDVDVEKDKLHIISSNEVVTEYQTSQIPNVDIDPSSPEKQNWIDVDVKQDKKDSSEEDEFLQLSDKPINEVTKEPQDTEISNVDSFGSPSWIKKNVHGVDAKEYYDNVYGYDVEDDHSNAEEDKYLQVSQNKNNEVMKESQDIKISTTNLSSSQTKQNVNVVDVTKYQQGSSITQDDKLFPSLSILEMELKLDNDCLDYDGEIEDDALSLATSCFNSPDEDRFSDSKVIEEKCKEIDAGQSKDREKSFDSGIAIGKVISPEQALQSIAGETEISSIPNEQRIEKGGYFLRKFRIPKVSCAEVTADYTKITSMRSNTKQADSGQSDSNKATCSQVEHTSAGAVDSLFRRFKIPKLCAETTTKFSKSPSMLCTELSCPQKSTESTTNKRHYENILRTVHNECSTEAETSEPVAGTVANTLYHLPPPLTTTTTAPATSFTVARFQRGADEIEMDDLVVPPPAHLLAEYAKMSRGKFAGRGGEALNRGPATQHIAKIFGVTCFSFLVGKCFELAACPFSHNFLDASLVKRRLELLPATDVFTAYQFMYNHKQLFRRYFHEFCKVYTNQKNSNKLLNMVYDCERRGENIPFLRSIFYSLVKCGFSKINACRHILSRSRDESKPTIDTLVNMIVESDWAMFSDHIERFSKIKHYTFRFNDLNQMATTVLDTKDSRLSQVFFNCLLTIEPEELGLIQQSPVLLHFLKLIESGKMRQ